MEHFHFVQLFLISCSIFPSPHFNSLYMFPHFIMNWSMFISFSEEYSFIYICCDYFRKISSIRIFSPFFLFKDTYETLWFRLSTLDHPAMEDALVICKQLGIIYQSFQFLLAKYLILPENHTKISNAP